MMGLKKSFTFEEPNSNSTKLHVVCFGKLVLLPLKLCSTNDKDIGKIEIRYFFFGYCFHMINTNAPPSERGKLYLGQKCQIIIARFAP